MIIRNKTDKTDKKKNINVLNNTLNVEQSSADIRLKDSYDNTYQIELLVNLCVM